MSPTGAYAQMWNVTFAAGPLAGWVGSCVTIRCSFSYPAGETVTAVRWRLDGDQTVYHSDNDRMNSAFKGRAQYLGDLQNNCSLRLARLRPSDQGTYRFRFETVNNVKADDWTSKTGQQLRVSASPCQPRLGSRMDPGPSLTCSVPDACPHHPSWYDADGARRSPGQTPAGEKATELPISPSRLPPGVALRCQVDGYWDGCGSDQPQPPGPVALNVPSVEVLWPGGKAAIKAGDGFTLRCQAGALGPRAGYVWSRGDVWLPGAAQDFRIDKTDVSDGGSYSCGVWVSGPGWAYLSLSARESVEVQDALKGVNLMATPGTVLLEGDPVKLRCRFSRSVPAAVTYTWYKDNSSLGLSQPELALQSVTPTDAGEYRCEVHNQAGLGRSPPVVITVRGRSGRSLVSQGSWYG
ncbi:sialoadhesin-like [Emydura macquarii macquarii]|uniref:sialoadhesin-like n=1 Tax=Emydura macquarii macquarii TaxID=1129001 RepID=UPI003529FEB7